MNMKMTRTKLNVAFKEFQRLPEWPIIVKLAGSESSSSRPERTKAAAAAPCSRDDAGSQAFAE